MSREAKYKFFRHTEWTQAHPEFHAHLHEALDNGIKYGTYFNRVKELGWDAKRAATTPPLYQSPFKTSVKEHCKQAGITRSGYYNVRAELIDQGIEHTPEDIVEIARTRQRKSS